MRVLLLTACLAGAAAAQQVPDTAFDVSVPRPAHAAPGPRVVIDEAHNNFHTSTGRYLPFANLLRNDGLRVTAGTAPFSAQSLRSADLLIISNALPPRTTVRSDTASSAFTAAEADAVRDWVHAGGALLLIADHAPFGGAAEILASRFGVDFGKGYAYDTVHYFTSRALSHPSILLFTHGNGLLGDHAIMRGRDTTERIATVVAFTGQSMSIPAGAVALLRLSPTAREAPDREQVAARAGVSVAGRAQGIAMQVGRGRVVILGEAAMMSAQVAGGNPEANEPVLLMGMNHPGTDDRQFALNVVRWLSGTLR
ncbi:MAG: DUF4350 domain-containing protein [Gemmatimonadaceae bacterium]